MAAGTDELLEGCAIDGVPVERAGSELVVGASPVGRIHQGERRLEWALPMDRRLEERVRVERDLFDARSLLLQRYATPREPAPAAAAWLDLRDEESPTLRALLPAEPSFEGARILELGGSGEATRGFLRAGARRIDQLDVSPGMHELARARLEPTERERVVQHTTAAERLPFADGTFDLVYSRHSLHHMHRPDVVPEVARVLKPSGWVLLIEPYLPGHIRALMRARRRLRKAERGTDDPLAAWDLGLVRSWFGSVRVRREPAASTLVRSRRRLALPLARLEVAGRMPPALLHLVGGRVVIAARRPLSP